MGKCHTLTARALIASLTLLLLVIGGVSATNCAVCDGTLVGDSTCLVYVSTAASWEDAVSYCAGLGLYSTLAFPTTAAGHTAYVSAKKQVADGTGTWMGAFSESDCNFELLNGVLMDDLPYSGDSGNAHGGCSGCTGIDSDDQCCMRMGTGENWNDDVCSTDFTFFCSSPIGDLDSDGICDWEDPCLHDDVNDADSDGVCESVDSCPGDALNDDDGDGVCDAVDSCLDDSNNDDDSDSICDSVDVCIGDPNNVDDDSDGVCDTIDSCPDDSANDVDSDGVCESVDSCPGDALNDDDGDGVCDAVDSCLDDSSNNDDDSDSICDSVDVCIGDPNNVDDDSDGVCDTIDSCPDDSANDVDSDAVCESVDSCPGDALNDDDGDGVCDAVDSCLDDSDNYDDDSDGICNSVDTCPSGGDEDSDYVCDNEQDMTFLCDSNGTFASGWVMLLNDSFFDGKNDYSFSPLVTGTFSKVLASHVSGFVRCKGSSDFSSTPWLGCPPYSVIQFEFMVNNTYVVEQSAVHEAAPECDAPDTPLGDIICVADFEVGSFDTLTPTWYEASHSSTTSDNSGRHVVDVYGWTSCPLDCLGGWQAWSECSAPCHRTRTFQIERTSAYGGVDCVVAAGAHQVAWCETTNACVLEVCAIEQCRNTSLSNCSIAACDSTTIDLSNRNLVGTIPRSLGLLAHAKIVDLSRNQLSGTLPPALSSLASVTTLNLRSNEFRGTIPASLASLANLESLDVSQNRLGGQLPASLCQLQGSADVALNNIECQSERALNYVNEWIGW